MSLCRRLETYVGVEGGRFSHFLHNANRQLGVDELSKIWVSAHSARSCSVSDDFADQLQLFLGRV